MPSALPPGDPAPADGSLPVAALASVGHRAFGVYVHVPFCRVRCGYCDFNTYTVPELGGPQAPAGASLDTYADAALAELALAAQVLDANRSVPETKPLPAVSTVFVGGGTPTMLPAADLVRVLHGIRGRFGLTPDAEVTTEANPDTITPEVARALVAGGFTRVSLGMQSAVPHVLAMLDRTHDPANVATAVRVCRDAGLAVSLDLIYGTPGESLTDWRASLQAAVDLAPDHVSAYALTIEEGTKLAAQVRRGQVPRPQDDDEADKYELADELLSMNGYEWYEISNWAANRDARCRHNLAYWRGADWWGIGPGAHSHVGGVRWWNVKHPAAYAARLAQRASPAQAREELSDEQRLDEQVLLGIRLADGLDLSVLPAAGRRAVAGLIADGLLQGAAAIKGRGVLTRRGRLLADTVVHQLLA
ncbi:MAG: radical SAM family heme chaperone HemW [Ornithinimicrobium sp.]|uniref:radical SAM family heme chaperone HemW n=1 Tax=Ornithinimicrobium sp. TaxID=1977084 RepID=UPI003D9B1428